MPIARFEMPDGRIARFEVPEGTTPEQAQAMIKAELPNIEAPAKQSSTLSNIAAGALKGATDIGSTLLSPIDAAARALGVQNEFIGRNDRRESSASVGADLLGADRESMAYKGGELATDIAGTAGIGGALAKGMRAIPAVANAAPKLINAIESGGFNLGAPGATNLAGKVANAATRATGGAVLGGASAGLIDPETADTGVMIGAAMPSAVKAAGMVGSGIKNAAATTVKNILGATTGTGGEAVAQAFKAGKQGNRAFLDNMRGNVDMTDVLDEAKAALGKIREDRAAAYRSGMVDIKGDKTVLDMAPVLKAADDATADTMFKGVVKKENAAKMAQKIKDTIDEWAGLSPAEYHTPEGLDALKQRIGDLRDATAFGSPERRVADSVYNSVKNQIQSQAPGYAKVMKDYSEASDLIGEIERSFVGKEKASVDTAMRKLQSLMRNNVNTNYGNRLDLAGELEKRGANILPSVAGQAMSSATPRGLQGLAATGTGIYSLTNPAAMAALPFQSPRVVGELAYGLGRASGATQGATAGLLGNYSMSQALANPAYAGLLTTVPAISFSR